MNDLLVSLICAHLVGDFVLQNHWQAANKAKSTHICLHHVVTYSLPFIFGMFTDLIVGLPIWALLLILTQHFFQDRYALHLEWMRWYGQTPSEKWPTGPLCVDQAFHIAFLWLIASLPF